MSRVNRAFAGKKAFIPFIMAGDPSLEITEKLVVEMAAAGADLIELGIPFSDPMAEGIVIQKADERALANGVKVDKIFEMVSRIRLKSDIPLAFMTYINPIFSYGGEEFFHNCQVSGIDAVIVPDMPFEEKQEILPYCQKNGVDLISMIAPTSKDRIKKIALEAQGFLYCVSSLGVTGVRENIGTDLKQMVSLVKAQQNIPCAVGFGISTPSQAKAMAQYADGVIVGSAIIKIIQEHGINCISPVCDYVARMKEAISS